MLADDLKCEVLRNFEDLAPTVMMVAREIHADPELAFKEFRASERLCKLLSDHGLAAQRPIAGLDTAFSCEFGGVGPLVAIISEYDALPEVGHACGHNIIAAAGLGAALALAGLGMALPGRVRYLGTPAEEGGGGKEVMARAGAFDGVDCAMMVHPSTEDLAAFPLLARSKLVVKYHGRAAHASSSPERGLNALDGLVLGYQSVAALRQHLPAGNRIHGVITNGGSATNVVPDLAEGMFSARAPDMAQLASLQVRVSACFEAGALATGTRVEVIWDDLIYADMRHNAPLASAYQKNGERLGRVFERFEDVPLSRAASSDMGNVSYRVPSIHPMIGMAPKGIAHHHSDFTTWAGSDEGLRAAVDGAKALALTCIDFMTDSGLRERVHKAFLTESSKVEFS